MRSEAAKISCVSAEFASILLKSFNTPDPWWWWGGGGGGGVGQQLT